jgi:outer membrane protein
MRTTWFSLLGLALVSTSLVAPRLALAQPAAVKPSLLKENPGKGDAMKGLKLAFVDVQGAILETRDGREAREAIEKEASKRRDEIMDKEKKFRGEIEAFQAQASVLSDSAKTAKQQEFAKRAEELQGARAGFEQEFREKEMKETQKILQKVVIIVEDLSKKNGYDMVFERSANALLYAARIDDITKEVVVEYNKRHSGKK